MNQLSHFQRLALLSLGSVVAYEAAHRLTRPLPLLITSGSPLGLRTIVYDQVVPQPPGYPPQVHRWVNVADRNDLVTAHPDLRPMFGLLPPKPFSMGAGWCTTGPSHTRPSST